eukprot:CAMPEP_0174364370 /NCGR_PEP_ID=MMETSP0811_2-20130205/72617_1 /TAXON_ID=73025 ORGANISM="Eutreptiella gymnastica-like, Strain CCMP1594" /NCGR_SAMPLE_ID=MMETSP0811_2 /ASSEMBLY_ACC=CAM_ASM_000667 /LENGTH=48 /DNA_ID= /DNA_START= /DNA_END= /DNA_ORIENTATION=
MKFIEGAGGLRPISGTQTSLWPLPPPKTQQTTDGEQRGTTDLGPSGAR